MKKTIILSLCALAALSCAKEQPTTTDINASDVKVVPATINATFDNSKLGLNGVNLVWEEGDVIVGRMAKTPSGNFNNTYDTFTAKQEGDEIKFFGDLTIGGADESGKINRLSMFAATSGKWGADNNSYNYHYTWPSTQTGRLSDIKDASISYAVTNKGDVKENQDGTYSVPATFNPFFSLLKFNVKEGLGVHKIIVKGEKFGGELILVLNRTKNYGGFGVLDSGQSYPFANWVSNTTFDSITITRNGDEISGDVYVSICPNTYDTTTKDFYNNTEQLAIAFYGSDDVLIKEYKRNLVGHLKNGEIMSLGNITSFESSTNPTKIEAIMSIRPSATTGNTFYPQFFVSTSSKLIDMGAQFYYTSSTESMDAVVTPTEGSTKIPENGLLGAPSYPYDCKYFKVLVTCPGLENVYFKLALRNWVFKENFASETNVGDITLPSGQLTTYGGNNLRVSAISAALATHAILGGNLLQYFKSNNSGYAQDYEFWVGSNKTWSISLEANAYSASNPGSFISDVTDNTNVGDQLQVVMKNKDGQKHNLYFWDYAILEWQEYTPEN